MKQVRALSALMAVAVIALAFYALFVPLNQRESGQLGSDLNVQAGEHRFQAASLTGRGDRAVAHRPRTPSASDPTNSPVRASSVEVTVLAQGAAVPIPDAEVFTSAREGGLVPRTRAVSTDETGKCRLQLREGERYICAFASGFVPTCAHLAADSTECILELSAGDSLSGKVVDESGRPVPGARVIGTTPTSGSTWLRSDDWLVAGAPGFVAQADESGHFKTRGIKTGERYLVYAIAQGYAPSVGVRMTLAKPGDDHVVIRMAACAEVRMRFLDATTRAHLRTVSVGAFDNGTTRALAWGWSGEPDRREQAEALWKGDYTMFLLAPLYPKEWAAEAELYLDVYCQRLGYTHLPVRVSARLGESNTIEVLLRRRIDGDWVSTRPRALFKSGLPFNGDLVVSFASDAGQMDRFVSFREGVAEEEILLPPGRYGIACAGARDIGSLWQPAGPAIKWTASGPDAPPSIRLSGNPIKLRVFDPDGHRVWAYRVGRLCPDVMPDWATVWSAHLSSTEEMDRPDAPFFIGPGACEIQVRTEDGLRGAVNWSGTGDGSPVELDIKLSR